MTSTASIVIDGYDLAAEAERVHSGKTASLQRGTAEVSASGEASRSAGDDVVAGMFVQSATGTAIDLRAADTLLDAHHTALERTRTLVAASSNDDDASSALRSTRDLAAFVGDLTSARFPGVGGYEATVSACDTVADSALKLGQRHAYRRFLRAYDHDVLARVMTDLDIALRPDFDPDAVSPEAIYEDHPFITIGAEQSRNDQTQHLAALTPASESSRVGLSTSRWIRHIPFNGDGGDLAARLDERPITEILDAPGGVSAVIASGKVPVDLVAQCVLDLFGDAGGVCIAQRDWLRTIAETCQQHGILLGVDESLTFGRTGELYAIEHYGVAPDVLWTSGPATCGLTIVRTEVLSECPDAANANSSASALDVNLTHATIDALVNHRSPVFLDRTTLENASLKGVYMRSQLAELAARRSDVFADFSGLGGVWGLTVQCREEVIDTAATMGVHLEASGPSGEFARLRVLLLADVYTREIDEAIAALDRVFELIEERHPEI